MSFQSRPFSPNKKFQLFLFLLFTCSPPASPLTSLSPAMAHVHSSSAPSASTSTTTSTIAPITPQALDHVLKSSRHLILDLRSQLLYSSSRLPNAIQLSVPSTLFRRPNFTLEKVSQSLASATDQQSFARWPHLDVIIAYDTDSQILLPKSNLLILLKKFEAEGFKGRLCFVQGGFAGVCQYNRHLLDLKPLREGDYNPNASSSSSCGSITASDSTASTSQQPLILRARDLPIAAFQQGTSSSYAVLPSVPTASEILTPSSATATTTSATHRPQTSSFLPAPAPTSTLQVPFNPFYDNIRQNTELSSGISSSEIIPLSLPAAIENRIGELPFRWLRNIVNDGKNGEALAMQFYKIEVGEQRRLMGIMDHHSRESDSIVAGSSVAASTGARTPGPSASLQSRTTTATGLEPRVRKTADVPSKRLVKESEERPFPFSITAGVERGHKNRFVLHSLFPRAYIHIFRAYMHPIGTETSGPLNMLASD